MSLKFSDKLDVMTFLAEIQDFEAMRDMDSIDENYQPTNEQLGSFLKARTPLVKKLKNYRKSSTQKSNWRENRYKMMKGIKAFHKSVEGKRFHKRLGRFLASRVVRKKEKTNEDMEYQMLMSKQSYLKGLNACKQHLFVELEYFHQVEEHLELEELLLDYAIPMFQRVEEKILYDQELNEDELSFVFDLTETNATVQAFADKSGKTFAEIEKMWKAISKSLEKQGISKDSEKFYPLLVGGIKKNLGITNDKKKQ
jgi:hypothetical protein